MNTPDVNTISAAEHTIAMMLSLSRNIPVGNSGLKSGEWNRNALVGTELRNKTLGIVGLGKIGREVLNRCRSFSMNILGYDPFMSQDMFNPEEVKIVTLDELTSQSDYISLHIPINDSTRDLFDYDRMSSMKPTARIVNVARGGIINEEDWFEIKDNIDYVWTKDSHFSELKNNEIIRERFEILSQAEEYIGKYISNDWVKKNILQQTDEEIKDQQAQMDKEKEEAELDSADDDMGDTGDIEDF